MIRLPVALIALVIAGCAATRHTPAAASPKPDAAAASTGPVQAAPQAAAKAPAAAPAAKASAPAAPESKVTAPTSPESKATAPTSPAPKATAPAAASHPPEAAPVAAKPAAPTLDLNTLEEQLKATKAIGVMSKLAIRNQVNDLIDEFRKYYDGKSKKSLTELRRSYDLLVMKVLGLVQNEDQMLATAVANSREAIWNILSDRNQFAKI